MEFWFKFLNVASMFIVPVLMVFILLLIVYIIYQKYKIKNTATLWKNALNEWKKSMTFWDGALNGWKKEMINFYRLCKIFDDHLTRELNKEMTEEEIKELSKFVKNLIKTEKDIDKSEEEI